MSMLFGTIKLWASTDAQDPFAWTCMETGKEEVLTTNIPPTTTMRDGVECHYWEIPLTPNNRKRVVHFLGKDGWHIECDQQVVMKDLAEGFDSNKNKPMPKPKKKKAPDNVVEIPKFTDEEKKFLKKTRKKILDSENKAYQDLSQEDKAELNAQAISILRTAKAKKTED